MVKVKKNAIRSCDCEYAKDYWVLRGTDEEIRPISVLLSDGTNISIGDPLLFLSYDKNQLSNFNRNINYYNNAIGKVLKVFQDTYVELGVAIKNDTAIIAKEMEEK